MITFATMLWQPNEHSYAFSRCYDEQWVTRLYEGIKRNINKPWRFVLFTDKERDLPPEIEQERIRAKKIDYGCYIEPFRYGVPMILMGLDTVITGNLDHLVSYCLTHEKLALPKDPNRPEMCCNGVALIPEGHQCVYRNWRGENDMAYLRTYPHDYIDDLFPGQVLSYKIHIKKKQMPLGRIIYFHGQEKPHELTDLPWIRRHWLGECPTQ